MTFDEEQLEWLRQGQEKGWVSMQFCLHHDGPPTTSEEDREWAEGGDPCIYLIRLTEPGVALSGGREGWSGDGW